MRTNKRLEVGSQDHEEDALVIEGRVYVRTPKVQETLTAPVGGGPQPTEGVEADSGDGIETVG